MKRLRGLVIGAGYFSHHHLDAWSRLPEAEIIAVFDRDSARALEVATKFHIPEARDARDLPTLLDRARPDFIDVVTPPETHLDFVRLAATRGIAVICQKPLAPTLAEARAIAAVAHESGTRLMVHENWRWQPWYRAMHRQLAAGPLGELFSISVRTRLGDGWPADAYLARQPFFRTYPRLLVYETAVHFLDTFRFLGGEITSIYARLQKRNPAIAGEDAAQIVCGFASGATALLDASRFNEPSDAADPRYTFGTVRLDARQGHLELAPDGTLTLKPLGESPRPLDYTPSRHGFAGDSVHATQHHFLDCLRTDRPFETSGEDYLKTTALVEACYESHATGRVIHLAS